MTRALRIVAILALVLVAFLISTQQVSARNHKIGICHATSSTTNPYVYIEVSENAAQAHLDGTHPSHHGVGPDDEDYLADDRSDCEVTPSSTPIPTNPSPSQSTTHTPSPTDTPTSTPTPVPTSSPSSGPTTPTATSTPTVSPSPITLIPDTATGDEGPRRGLLVTFGLFLIAAGLYFLATRSDAK